MNGHVFRDDPQRLLVVDFHQNRSRAVLEASSSNDVDYITWIAAAEMDEVWMTVVAVEGANLTIRKCAAREEPDRKLIDVLGPRPRTSAEQSQRK